MNDALLWEKADDGAVVCGLCAHRCRINPGKRGICGVRVNDGGALRTYVYGRSVAVGVDPIEKKPLYHFLPSSTTYSIAAAGCNFSCDFCQNWNISQVSKRGGGGDSYGSALSTREIVGAALGRGCGCISFTYTEPTVFFEYALDTAIVARAAGLKTVFVTNGYMTPECLQKIGPYLDACNVDLKSFREEFYKARCGASLAPVLEALKNIRAAGIWMEVTTLIIPGENDSDGELSDIAGFIVGELGDDVPWHVSKFFPQYRMSSPAPGGSSSIDSAVRIGRGAGLRYVYAGNVDYARDTLCPGCGAVAIGRRGYRTDPRGLDAAGLCRGCGMRISGIFS